MVEVVVLSGTLTSVILNPEKQETVTGRRPTAVLEDDNVQLEALITFAETMTTPPVQASGDGLVPRPVMTGGVDAGETLIFVVADLLEAAPLATSFTV